MATRDPLDLTDGGRLRRLEALDELLPTLAGVLDVREVFVRISEIAHRVLPHDFMALPILDDDGEHVVVHAISRDLPMELPRRVPLPDPTILSRPWDYEIFPDLREHPIEKNNAPVKLGYRSLLRLPLRIEGRLLGALHFFSSSLDFYQQADVLIGQRVADHVLLSLWHSRLVEQATRAAAVRERAASLTMLDDLLSTLTGVLDMREVFDRISEIAHDLLSHDGMAIITTTDDPERVQVYALRGYGVEPLTMEARNREPELVSTQWDYKVIDDLLEHPAYADTVAVKAGMRSALMLPVRFAGRLQALVNFVSREPAHFSADDVLVARRVVDHVALALSHQRLAEEARESEDLRAREANLELLDDLLATLTDAGELRDLFERISAIAKNVLRHDAMALLVRLPDGVNAKVYANSGFPMQLPDIVRVPEAMLNEDRDFYIVHDVRASNDLRSAPSAAMGFRGSLGMPIRLDGRFAGGLSFLSFTVGAFKTADGLIARRIADRLTLALSREQRAQAATRADEATARATTLEARVQRLTEELDARTGFRRVSGDSREWRQVLTHAAKVAATEATVLLLGESGTGKEVVARFVHRASARGKGPYVALNCAALPEHLFEAELFGYERGAFTGAMQAKPGQLEQASGGTLFLDEVGEMSLAAQAKVLRVLQEREFQRLGGTRVLRTDARMIAATNRNLQRAIEQGTFREDLFYRLNVFAIQLPPLRERRDDILPLSEAFLAEIGQGLGRPPAGISRDARARLMEHSWPGNVRELRNILERAAILCDGGLITSEHLALMPAADGRTSKSATTVTPEPSEEEKAADEPAGGIQSVERAMIERALQDARFNKSKAAKILGLTRTQLYGRMRRYGLS